MSGARTQVVIGCSATGRTRTTATWSMRDPRPDGRRGLARRGRRAGSRRDVRAAVTPPATGRRRRAPGPATASDECRQRAARCAGHTDGHAVARARRASARAAEVAALAGDDRSTTAVISPSASASTTVPATGFSRSPREGRSRRCSTMCDGGTLHATRAPTANCGACAASSTVPNQRIRVARASASWPTTVGLEDVLEADQPRDQRARRARHHRRAACPVCSVVPRCRMHIRSASIAASSSACVTRTIGSAEIAAQRRPAPRRASRASPGRRPRTARRAAAPSDRARARARPRRAAAGRRRAAPAAAPRGPPRLVRSSSSPGARSRRSRART